MKNKKGISPLIATVLIIGFAIALSALLWVFLSDTVNIFVTKEGAVRTCEAKCVSEVKFTATSCTTTASGLSVTVTNTGEVPITAWKLRANGLYQTGDSESSFSTNKEIEARSGESKTISVTVPYETINSVEVFPTLVCDEYPVTCNDKDIKVICQ